MQKSKTMPDFIYIDADVGVRRLVNVGVRFECVNVRPTTISYCSVGPGKERSPSSTMPAAETVGFGSGEWHGRRLAQVCVVAIIRCRLFAAELGYPRCAFEYECYVYECVFSVCSICKWCFGVHLRMHIMCIGCVCVICVCECDDVGIVRCEEPSSSSVWIGWN